MLIAITIWFAVLSAAWGYGKLAFGADHPASAESVVCRLYAGLLLIAAMLFVITIFSNVTVWLGLVILIPGLIVAAVDPALARNRPVLLAAAAMMIPIALWVASREVSFYDTALYHQQVAKWLSSYGLVRGIGLICFRFALVSSWFAAAASMNHGGLEGRVAGVIGGLPIALMVVPSLLLCRNLVANRTPTPRSVTWVVFSFTLAVIALTKDIGNSLSPDMMAWLAPGVVILVLTNVSRSESERIGQALVIAALAFLAKVSAAPALAWCGILAAGYLLRDQTGRVKLVGYSMAAAVFVTLFLIGNTIASGCPLFPAPLGCMSAAWSVGTDYAIRNLAAVEGYNTSGRYDNQMHALLALSFVSSVIIVCLRRFDSFIRHGLGVSWLGILFVFTTAPVPRYGMGYFLLPPAIACALIVEFLWKRWHRTVIENTAVSSGSRISAGGLPMFFGGVGIVACLLQPGALHHLLAPARMARSVGDPIHVSNQTSNFRGYLRLQQIPYGQIVVWTPSVSDQCWDAPLPCSASVSADRLALRHPQEGFRGGFVRVLNKSK